MSRARVSSGLVLLGAVALVAFNLRPAVVAVGPLADDVRASTGLGPTAIGLLTTLPVLCFGAFAPLGSAGARRLGLERAVLVALALLILGIALRLLSPVAILFAGSLALGVGIAMGNVLMPAVVKRYFASRTGPAMAAYTVALNTGAAVAAGLAVPLRDGFAIDWRLTLALCGLPAVLALLAWLPYTRHRARSAEDAAPPPAVWGSRLAWACAGFIGFQSAVFYSLTAWVPSLLTDAGLSEGRAGLMLSLLAVVGISGALVIPVLAARSVRQRYLVVFVALTFALGLIGLIVAPASATIAWMILLGVGQGSGIALALTLFVLRTRTTAGAASLSAMAQTVGYLLAAVGPLALGALHELTGGWEIPVAFLLVILAPLLLSGWSAGSERTLEDEIATGGPAPAGRSGPAHSS